MEWQQAMLVEGVDGRHQLVEIIARAKGQEASMLSAASIGLCRHFTLSGVEALTL